MIKLFIAYLIGFFTMVGVMLSPLGVLSSFLIGLVGGVLLILLDKFEPQ